MLRRNKNIKYFGFPSFSVIGRWVVVLLILIAIAVIWIFYFISNEYLGVGNARIHGSFYYKDSPLIGVSVRIDGEEITSDEDGYFVFPNLSLGKKKLEISKENFLPKEKEVFVWKKNIRLKKVDGVLK